MIWLLMFSGLPLLTWRVIRSSPLTFHNNLWAQDGVLNNLLIGTDCHIACRARQEAEAVSELPSIRGPQHGRDRALRGCPAAVCQVLCGHPCQL